MFKVINDGLLMPVLPLVIISVGAYYAVKLKFFIFRHPVKAIKALFGRKSGGISSFKAACVALSGTLGVGNIAGVASAIIVGGPGAVFWMLVSAFFAMILKYVEVVTAMCGKKNGHGGAPYYIEKNLGSKKLGTFFALLIIFASFSVGNIVQSSAAAVALDNSFGITKYLTGIIIAVTVYLLLMGGIRRVAGFSSVVIPILSLGYVILSLAIIIKNADTIPGIIKLIVKDAFSVSSVFGGGVGFLMNRAMRFGTARGVLSNEAGCGTASLAHSSADSRPAEQGMFGIFEVFTDTVLLCTITALSVLIAFPGGTVEGDGMSAAIEAFSRLGKFGGNFISASTAIYAVASIVCWSYYGTECLTYLGCGKKTHRAYILIYSAVGIAGAIFAPSVVWELADFSVSALAIINTVCLALMPNEAVRCTEEYFDRKKSK